MPEGPKLEITPEATEVERKAVERALADGSNADVPPAYVSPWRCSGLPGADEPEAGPRV